MLNTMKKPISVLLAFAVAVISLSCKSFDPKLYDKTATFDSGMPSMRVIVNTDSIKTCFKGGWRDRNEYRTLLNKFYDGDIQEYPGAQGVYVYGYACCSYPEQVKIINLIRQNLMFDRDTKAVYLGVLVRKIEWARYAGWIVFGPMTAGFFYFFGGPALTYAITVEMEAALMRPDGRILKTYSVKSKNREHMAFYWGYYESEVLLPLYVNGLINACADIRKQIEADRENINKLIR